MRCAAFYNKYLSISTDRTSGGKGTIMVSRNLKINSWNPDMQCAQGINRNIG